MHSQKTPAPVAFIQTPPFVFSAAWNLTASECEGVAYSVRCVYSVSVHYEWHYITSRGRRSVSTVSVNGRRRSNSCRIQRRFISPSPPSSLLRLLLAVGVNDCCETTSATNAVERSRPTPSRRRSRVLLWIVVCSLILARLLTFYLSCKTIIVLGLYLKKHHFINYLRFLPEGYLRCNFQLKVDYYIAYIIWVICCMWGRCITGAYP